MKTDIAKGVVVLAIACLAAGLGSSPELSAAAAKPDPIRIGWIGSLSGYGAPWGVSEFETIRDLVEKTNAAGGIAGRRVELFPYDIHDDATAAIDAVKTLCAEKKVVAILGPDTSGVALAVYPSVERYSTPFVATTATNPKVTAGDDGTKTWAFRACFPDPYQAAVAASRAFDDGARKAAIVFDRTMDYSVALADSFKSAFERLGGKVVASEATVSGDTDFRAPLARIRKLAPDIVFLPLFYAEVGSVARQARSLGLRVPFCGGDGWGSDQLPKLAGTELEGSWYVDHVNRDDPAVAAFASAFEARTGRKPEVSAFLARDACALLVDALARSGGEGGMKLVAALEYCDIEGFSGRLAMDSETHDPFFRRAAIVAIRAGAFRQLGWYAPAFDQYGRPNPYSAK